MNKMELLGKPSLSFKEKESLNFLLDIEGFCENSMLAKSLISYHILQDNKPNPIVESTLDLEFESIDYKKIENSKLKSAVWHVSPIEEYFPGDVIIDAEALMESGVLTKYQEKIYQMFPKPVEKDVLDEQKFAEYVEQNDIKDVLQSLHEEKIKLSFPIDLAFMQVLANNPVHATEITKFIKSPFFTEECSVLVLQKEYYVLTDIDELKEILTYPIQLDAKWTLVKRFAKENKDFPKIYSTEEMKQVIESIESYDKFKEDLFTKRLMFSKENLTPLSYINLEFEQYSMEEALVDFMKERTVSDQQITDYIFRPNASTRISDIVIAKADYYVLEPRLYLKLSDAPSLSLDAKEALIKRYEGFSSKELQNKYAIKFQSLDAGVIPYPTTSEEILELMTESTLLYKLVKEIDQTVTQSVISKLPYVDGEFDAVGFPLVAEYKISRVLMTAFRNPKAPAEYVMYIHNCANLISPQKIQEVLAHPSCPNSLIESYLDQRPLYIYILKNLALSQDIIVKMVSNLKDIGGDEVIYKALVSHPNCPPELRVMLAEGIIGYLNRIKNEENSSWLAEQARLLIFYPTNWPLPRVELSIKDKHNALSLIIKNPNTATFTINQLLDFYSGIETSESEASTQFRQLFLARRDCPKKMIQEMINAASSNIRLEVVNSSIHFNEEAIVGTALENAFYDHLDMIGDLGQASSKLLRTELSKELKEIIANSPIQEQSRLAIKDKILTQLDTDIQKKNPVINLNVVKFLQRDELIAGIIPILPEEKNSILEKMKQANL